MMTIIVGKEHGMELCKMLALKGYYNRLKPVAPHTYELTTKAPREIVNSLIKYNTQGGEYLWEK